MGGSLHCDHAGNAKSSAADRSPGIGGNWRGEAELTDDEWLNIWAFGTSPYGLVLSEGRLWRMTPREFLALKKVWATEQAAFHNAHFRPADDTPFLPEDFITPEARTLRRAQMLRDKAAVMAESSRLSMMRVGDDDGVPQAFKDMVN